MSDPVRSKAAGQRRSTSFAEASAVRRIDSHTYAAFIPDDWLIGTVPHGGLVASIFLQTASQHFATTLQDQDQPHTIALHLDFLRRSQAGPAKLVVKDAKLGRQTSVIHITLIQDDNEEVVGYLTNSNMGKEVGISLDTEYSLHPPPVSADLAKLRDDTDPNWFRVRRMPDIKFRSAFRKLTTWLPKQGQHHQSLADEWVSFSTGEKFTNESLGFVCDMWPVVTENFRPRNTFRIKDNRPPKTPLDENTAHWYPTLVMNLDIKKALPEEGVDFLFVRVRTKGVKNGRLDAEVVIMDERGEIVALSHHVCLAVGVERNLADRKRGKL
ncbi:hypothetical protein GP486_005193 [Trichoglossum hirsutum]|uniref:Thioesterase family protein n=1 Tax=Trichoglossum hirsutum TaxID=265104 RepID=A0A9P8RN58_9PEZI|nr:hypothetical protein GP486_005193 [Trichoglossum hirsutum]